MVKLDEMYISLVLQSGRFRTELQKQQANVQKFVARTKKPSNNDGPCLDMMPINWWMRWKRSRGRSRR